MERELLWIHTMTHFTISRTILWCFCVLSIAFLLTGGFYLYAVKLPRLALEADMRKCAGAEEEKIKCYQSLILSVFDAQGLEKALSLVGQLYDTDAHFASQCHGNLHELGAAAYALYEKGKKLDLPPETSYCGFGFFHGFLEALILTEGDPEGAGDFCRNIGVDESWSRGRSTTSCFHGIGHGITDGMDPSLWGKPEEIVIKSLSICKEIAHNDNERRDCASGTFNSLAILYRHPKYELHGDPSDPYAFCRHTKMEDPFTEACYSQMNTYVLLSRDFEEAIGLVQDTVPQAFWRHAINGLAVVAVRDTLFGKGELARLRDACTALPETETKYCVRDLVGGIFEFGQPEREYLQAIEFCEQTGPLMRACASGFSEAVAGFYGTPAQKRACASLGAVLGDSYKKLCSEIVSERVKGYLSEKS